jgi:hypothetical protein
LSEAAISDNNVIYTDQLDRHLSFPWPATNTAPLSQDRFRSPAHADAWIEKLVRPGVDLHGNSLVFVEAGIRVRQLMPDLRDLNLALPTDSGSAQTVLGAMSTGTHGADVHLSPLSDYVRAIHLVGSGGQEWWVEPSRGVVDGGKLNLMPFFCPGLKLVQDDDFFHSVLVSVGRFGVVYSIVLEVVPSYYLEEFNSTQNWPAVRAQLLDSVQNGYTSGQGIFSDNNLRFYTLVVDPTEQQDCWIKTRSVTASQEEVPNDSPRSALDAFCLLQGYLVAAMLEFKGIVMAAVFIAAEAVAAIPIVGAFLAGALILTGEAATDYLIYVAGDSKNLGEFIARTMDTARTIGLSGFLIFVNKKALASAFDPNHKTGPSYKILGIHDYGLDGCFSVDSAEYFFDANQRNYIDFVDELLSRERDLGPIPGMVSFRFVHGSQAKLAMERWSQTVAIEVAVIRPWDRTYFDASLGLALKHGGIPHWGQEHHLDVGQVEGIYQDDLTRAFRWALAEVERAGVKTFSSKFSRDRGLETTRDLAEYRLDRFVGAIVSAIS